MKSRSILGGVACRFCSSTKDAAFSSSRGAPEDVLKLSDRYELSGESDTQPFDATALARANKQFQTLCEEGFRVLGIAWREEPASQTHVVESDEQDFVFAGYAAFLDPPKASAGAAIAALESGGVDIKIITGDNERVTQYVGTQLGIPVEGLLTGTELNRAQ
jgi:P-type Mg2+ transporter